MSFLPRTEEALAEIAANKELLFGVHDGHEIGVGREGVFVGERPFDPASDDPGNILTPSVWEMITDEPQVALRIPDHPLRVQVVTHERREAEDDAFGIIPAKRRLSAEMVEALRESLPGMTDRVAQYAVGEAATSPDFEIEAITTDGQPLSDAKTIADLCQNGLTFVVSDYLALPLAEQMQDKDLPMAIAIKANHGFDLKLPANVGSLRSGYRGGEINTNGPGLGSRVIARLKGQEAINELDQTNQELANMHRRTVMGLEQAGIAVAQVVLESEQPLGFDVDSVDVQIARAVESLESR